MKFTYVLLFTAFFAGELHAQDEPDDLQEREYQLECLAINMMNARDATERESNIVHFQRLFHEALQMPDACRYPFRLLHDYVSFLYPKDSSFRVITWSQRFYPDSFEFGGAIQVKLKNECKTCLLMDKTYAMKKEDLYGSINSENWRGALYYQMFQVGKKDEKYFILLGWDGHTRASNKKVIEPMVIDSEGRPIFGRPVFALQEGKPLQSRVIFEFSDRAVMSLRHEASKNVIVWEHLSPPNPRATGQYSLYLPDGTYDYFQLKKGIWEKKEMLFEKFSVPTNMDGKDIIQP